MLNANHMPLTCGIPSRMLHVNVPSRCMKPNIASPLRRTVVGSHLIGLATVSCARDRELVRCLRRWAPVPDPVELGTPAISLDSRELSCRALRGRHAILRPTNDKPAGMFCHTPSSHLLHHLLPPPLQPDARPGGVEGAREQHAHLGRGSSGTQPR